MSCAWVFPGGCLRSPLVEDIILTYTFTVTDFLNTEYLGQITWEPVEDVMGEAAIVNPTASYEAITQGGPHAALATDGACVSYGVTLTGFAREPKIRQ